MERVPDILVGPVHSRWRQALLDTAPSDADLTFADTRREFLRLFRLNLNDIVVVTATDASGIPTLPLLTPLSPSVPTPPIILIHDTAVVHLPSSWTTDTAAIHHLLRGNQSLADVTSAMWQFVSRLHSGVTDVDPTLLQ